MNSFGLLYTWSGPKQEAGHNAPHYCHLRYYSDASEYPSQKGTLDSVVSPMEINEAYEE